MTLRKVLLDVLSDPIESVLDRFASGSGGVFNSAGVSFDVTTDVLNSTGFSFTVEDEALNSSGTGFKVFA